MARILLWAGIGTVTAVVLDRLAPELGDRIFYLVTDFVRDVA